MSDGHGPVVGLLSWSWSVPCSQEVHGPVVGPLSMGHGHGPVVSPLSMGHGHGPVVSPLSMGHGHGPVVSPLSMGHGHGPVVGPLSMAMVQWWVPCLWSRSSGGSPVYGSWSCSSGGPLSTGRSWSTGVVRPCRALPIGTRQFCTFLMLKTYLPEMYAVFDICNMNIFFKISCIYIPLWLGV